MATCVSLTPGPLTKRLGLAVRARPTLDAYRATCYTRRVEFKDSATEDIYDGIDSKDARRALPRELHARAAELLDRLARAATPNDLRTPVGNRLEKLSGTRKGQWSVRINGQYRICCGWEGGGAVEVEITDYH